MSARTKKSRFRAPPPRISVAPHSRLVLSSVILAGAVTLLCLMSLRWFNVPLGQGFAYRYSKLAEMKSTTGVWQPLAICALLIPAAVWIARPARRSLGLAVGSAILVMLAIWTALAMPQPIRQHSVNMVSPAQDGAFVLEAREVKSLGAYLRNFNTYIQRSVRSMGGTRILANPPGMTILAVAEMRAFPMDRTWGRGIERMLAEQQEVQEDEAVYTFANGLRFGVILLAMWMLSAPLAYLLGRQSMAPLGAALFALAVTFNPCTVHFSPGKDAAQLLTINAMLLAWFAGVRRDRLWLTALGGAVLLIGAISGLIHFWIAIAALAASCWQAQADGTLKRVLLRHVTAATTGFLLVVGVIYLVSGWNSLATLIATGRNYDKVKNTIGINETLWFFIGLPIFLLFVTPAFWTSLLLTFRRRRWRLPTFGRRLLVCTVASMTLSYTLGVSWELPRVWIAYLPLLILAVMVDVPLFRSANRRAVRPVLAIAIAVLIFTALHWTFLDVRESEYRSILTNRAWY